MVERMSAKDYQNLLKKLTKKKNKFNVAPKELRTWTGYFRGRKQTIVFHSVKEMNHFWYLLNLYKKGEIQDLQMQERFILEEFGENIRPLIYVSDFSYYEKGVFIVEDVKSEYTRKLQPYKNKIKMFNKKFSSITFKEIL